MEVFSQVLRCSGRPSHAIRYSGRPLGKALVLRPMRLSRICATFFVLCAERSVVLGRAIHGFVYCVEIMEWFFMLAGRSRRTALGAITSVMRKGPMKNCCSLWERRCLRNVGLMALVLSRTRSSVLYDV